ILAAAVSAVSLKPLGMALAVVGLGGLLGGAVLRLQRMRLSLEAALAEARRDADQARAEHARLRGALEALPEPVILFDADDRVVMWNRLYAQNSSLAAGHGDGTLRPG